MLVMAHLDIFQARNPRRRLRDLVGHDAQVHWPDDICLHWVGRCISSLLNPICHVNYVTLLLTAYYVDHFRVVSILCTSLEYPIQLGKCVPRSPGSFPGASS